VPEENMMRTEDAETPTEWSSSYKEELPETEEMMPPSGLNNRPFTVTLIALFQFCKAGFLVVLLVLIGIYPDMRFGSETFWEIVYVASNGAGKPGLLTPLIAIYAAVIGWGLWSLNKWARNLLMVTSGLSALRWVRYFGMNWAVSGTEVSRTFPSLKSGFEQQSVYLLVALEVLVFCCLAFGPDVAEAFGRNE
jgi:hypothetical protein